MDFNEAINVLGEPLPVEDRHAVSVSMPTWKDVHGYEQGKAEVHEKLKTGYPRFFLHPSYKKLCDHYKPKFAKNGESIWVFPSLKVAEECVAYVGIGRTENTNDGVALVIIPENYNKKAKEFWQHTGQIVSSRQADDILFGTVSTSTLAHHELKQLLGQFNGSDPRDTFLFPSGMGALFAAYKAIVCNRGSQTIQLGFPYIDTLKFQEKFGQGAVYIPYNSVADFKSFEQRLNQGPSSAVFCEIPGNPLLRTIHLPRLKEILTPRGIPLVIDDTLGPPTNLNLSSFGDIRATSLTKFMSGVGNVMAGAVTLNPQSPHYSSFRDYFQKAEQLLYARDALVLFQNAQGFLKRMPIINHNAKALAGFLRDHPMIDQVFFPEGDQSYELLRKPGGGYGGLLSFTLQQEFLTPTFHDALHVAKGPSLGNVFTIASPYTLLAHYNEQSWAQKNNVSPSLIRVSVGMEETPELIQRFDRALQRAALFP